MTNHNASLLISFKMKQKMRKDSQTHEAWKSGLSYIEIESHIKNLELKNCENKFCLIYTSNLNFPFVLFEINAENEVEDVHILNIEINMPLTVQFPAAPRSKGKGKNIALSVAPQFLNEQNALFTVIGERQNFQCRLEEQNTDNEDKTEHTMNIAYNDNEYTLRYRCFTNKITILNA